MGADITSSKSYLSTPEDLRVPIPLGKMVETVLLQEEEKSNPQLFHIACGFGRKATFSNKHFQAGIRPTFLEFSIRDG